MLNLLGSGWIYRTRRRRFVSSSLNDPNPMDVILLAYELLRSDHQLVEVVDDAVSRTDSDTVVPGRNELESVRTKGGGAPYMYCSSSNNSSVPGSTSSSSASRTTSRPWLYLKNRSNNGQGVICGIGVPLRSAVEIRPKDGVFRTH